MSVDSLTYLFKMFMAKLGTIFVHDLAYFFDDKEVHCHRPRNPSIGHKNPKNEQKRKEKSEENAVYFSPLSIDLLLSRPFVCILKYFRKEEKKKKRGIAQTTRKFTKTIFIHSGK